MYFLDNCKDINQWTELYVCRVLLIVELRLFKQKPPEFRGHNGNMVYEFTSDDSNTYTYGHRLLYSDDYKYVLNAHGDVFDLFNSDGETVKEYDYDAFGNELNPSASDTNPFRYCAEYFDVESGQIYLRNRYYQPVTGRFTQLDPIRDGLNWYAYCANNPIVFVDRSGLTYIIAWSYSNSDVNDYVKYKEIYYCITP